MDGCGGRTDDFRRMSRSTMSDSLLMLTTRCDIFMSIVADRCSGEWGSPGDNDRCLEDLRLSSKLELLRLRPLSSCRRSSPKCDPFRERLLMNRTLKFEVALGRFLSCRCASGVRGASSIDDRIGDELVNGIVSSSSAIPLVIGEKNVGPSCNCTDTISSSSSSGTVRILGRLALVVLVGLGGISSTSSPSSSGGNLGSALKLNPANPMAAWNAPRSSTSDRFPSSSASGIRSRCPVGDVTNATGDGRPARACDCGGLGDPSVELMGAYCRPSTLSRLRANSARPRSLKVRLCDSGAATPRPPSRCAPLLLRS